MIDVQLFKKVLGHFTTGVTVATTLTPDQKPWGITINAFTSLSLEPPLILFCLDKQAKSVSYFKGCSFFGINILAQDQRLLSVQFASKHPDKWRGIPHSFSPQTGCPILAGCLAHIECERHEVLEGGDHWIIIGKVVALKATPNLDPLVYFKGQYTNITGIPS